MTYFKGLVASFAVALGGFFLLSFIVTNLDPSSADILAKAAFFASIFVMLAGLFVPLLFYTRLVTGNREILFANFPVAVRQGILLSAFVTVLLLLQALRALTWWDAILLLAGVGFAELAFRSRR